MSNEYDIRAVFEEMELELIRSMRRNLSRHQKWESKEGINWTMWQSEQLKTLERFKKENKDIFTKKFTNVNNEIARLLEDTYKTSGFKQEREILEKLSKGEIFTDSVGEGLEGSFFNINEKKMHALINAVNNDMDKAERAMLRMANDQYRKIIYKSQVMANSGAFTLKQSIDKASRDFLKRGFNCVQYKDGRRVNIASYAEMAIRTANKRAMLTSEAEARDAYGIHTVRVSKYSQCSETCLPWQGKVYVDDVWGKGTKEEADKLNLPLLSIAVEGGLFHPNCRHRVTTYFYDLKEEQGKLEDDGIEITHEEQEHRKNQLRIQQQRRLEEGSLDSKNVAEAKQRREVWEEKNKSLMQSGALSGAWNDLNDPMNKHREKIAYDLYKEIVNRKKEFEIKSVAKHSGFDIEDVERIYNHVFIRKHLFEDGEIHKFYPDYYMAHSWMRIRDGKKIYKHDMIMLYHELEEEKIMGDSLNVVYEVAHEEVEKKYNYRKELLEYLKNHDV